MSKVSGKATCAKHGPVVVKKQETPVKCPKCNKVLYDEQK